MYSGPGQEILLAVEAHADPFGDAAAAALALLGAAAGNRLDRQPLRMGPRVVAVDPGQSRVDDVADAGNRQRRFGDVGGDDDAAAVRAGEHPLLLGSGQAAEQRQDLDVPFGQPVLQEVAGLADVPLPGHEYEDVPGGRLLQQLFDRGHRCLGVGELLPFPENLFQRPVADLDRVHPAGDLDDRSAAESPRELFDVDGRRGDDELEAGPPLEKQTQVPQQEIDVEAAFVGFVEDDGVVLEEIGIAADLAEQHAVGDQLDQGLRPRSGPGSGSCSPPRGPR